MDDDEDDLDGTDLFDAFDKNKDISKQKTGLPDGEPSEEDEEEQKESENRTASPEKSVKASTFLEIEANMKQEEDVQLNSEAQNDGLDNEQALTSSQQPYERQRSSDTRQVQILEN